MFKSLLREPFKGQASVRALDEADATGEHATTNPRNAHPTGQDCGGPPLETGWVPIPSQPVPAGLPSPLFFPLAHRGPGSEEQVERAQK